MTRWAFVTFAFALACKGKEAPARDPPSHPPIVAIDAAMVVDAPRPALATPRTKHGLIVFTTSTVARAVGTEPLRLVDPDGGEPILALSTADHLVIGPHIIAGAHGVIDLRAPTLAAKASKHAIEFVTPDDRLVARCSGGVGETFKVCTSDGDPQIWKDLYEEPAKGFNDIATVAGAGREMVHCNYGQLSQLPAFSIRIGDTRRTDYPGLVRKDTEFTYDPFYSPDGTLAATCMSLKKDLVVTTLDGSVKPQAIQLDGEPVRCSCKFSHDNARLACSILYLGSRSPYDVLWMWNLETKRKTLLAKQVVLDGFVWSPDDTQLAFVGVAEDVARWVLRTTTLDGTTTRDLFSVDLKTQTIDLAGWTAP